MTTMIPLNEERARDLNCLQRGLWFDRSLSRRLCRFVRDWLKIASGRKNKRSLIEQSKLETKSIWPMLKRKNLQPVSKRNTLVRCLSSGHSEEVPEVHILCQARET